MNAFNVVWLSIDMAGAALAGQVLRDLTGKPAKTTEFIVQYRLMSTDRQDANVRVLGGSLKAGLDSVKRALCSVPARAPQALVVYAAVHISSERAATGKPIE